jgi:hypothetical protein
MMDAANFDIVETLKNGCAVRIRSIRADDKNRISEAFRNLEPESVYARFFYHKKTLTDAELKAVTEVDFEDAVALVVAIAREKGLSHFEAEVLSENKAMLTVFSRSGLPMKQSAHSGTVHVCLSLTADMISISEEGEKP